MSAHPSIAVTGLKNSVIAFVCYAISQRSFGADQVIQCPLEIPAASVQLAHAPEGWTVFGPHSIALRSAGFMNGPAARLADLKPDSINKNKNESIETWTFEDYKDEIWLSRGYGDGAEITLSKKIPESIAECTIYYKKIQRDWVFGASQSSGAKAIGRKEIPRPVQQAPKRARHPCGRA